MKSGFLWAAKRALPKAEVVIDPFHIIQDANRRLDEARRTTNAFTEGMHTKIKLIKRLSYGFNNVGIYIKKMLLACAPIALLFNGIRHTFC